MTKQFLCTLLLVCSAGTAFAAEQADLGASVTLDGEWCGLQDMACTSGRSYCFKGSVYKCGAGFKCDAAGGGGCIPVKDEGYECNMGRYKCISTTHFCNGGIAQRCAKGTWCVDGNPDLSPCRGPKPTGTCPRNDRQCLNSRSYCINGQTFKCPAGYVCAGMGPCVEAA